MRHWFLIFGLIAAPTGRASVHVKSVVLAPSAHGYRLRVQASGTANYNLHMYPEPARLIVDIPKAVLDIDSRVGPVQTGGGAALRFSQFTRNPDAVRVVVTLPAGASTWREASASPAEEIVVDIPANVAPPERAATVRSTRTRFGRRPAAQPTRLEASEHPRTPDSVSARELERRQIEAGEEMRSRTFGPPSPVTPSAQPSRPSRKSARARSRLASRGGEPDTTSLMVDPAAAPAPAWDPAEAVSLIKDAPCPEALRTRLIDIVSDRAIQTSNYVWGGQTVGQFDCSGLAVYIYNGIGVKLPRTSIEQCVFGEPITRQEDLRAGDLVFFITRGTCVSHVGIYLGDGRFLHAANPRSNLKITSLNTPYYAARYAGARRVYGVAESESSRLGG